MGGVPNADGRGHWPLLLSASSSRILPRCLPILALGRPWRASRPTHPSGTHRSLLSASPVVLRGTAGCGATVNRKPPLPASKSAPVAMTGGILRAGRAATPAWQRRASLGTTKSRVSRTPAAAPTTSVQRPGFSTSSEPPDDDSTWGRLRVNEARLLETLHATCAWGTGVRCRPNPVFFMALPSPKNPALTTLCRRRSGLAVSCGKY